MTIIVFLVDTSASMAMKTYMGTTVLDFARKTIEEFLKVFKFFFFKFSSFLSIFEVKSFRRKSKKL